MVKFNLVCWNCGKKIGVKCPRHPQFAVDLAKIADNVGWIGIIDLQHSRSLVFCLEKCKEEAKTKKGTYRVRRKRR